MLRISDLTKIYTDAPARIMALENITLSIHPGEYVVVLGPSGSGKTTLLNILGLLDRPTSGEYLCMGRDVRDLSESQRMEMRRTRMGFIFQQCHLIDELNVYENVELPLLSLAPSPSQRRRRVLETLEDTGMLLYRRHHPRHLSGGQRQRTAVARALVTAPPLLLVDEPTGNLDSDAGKEIMRLLQQRHAMGTTVLMVTHQTDYADCGGRTIHLFEGKIVAENIHPRSPAPGDPGPGEPENEV